MKTRAFPVILSLILALFAGRSEAADNSFIVTTEEWPPFVSRSLENDGWAMEVARAALEPAGYEVALRLVPWARAVKCAKSGDCDGLYLAYFAEERTQWFAFSEPIGEVRTGFFKLKDRDIAFSALDDLKDYRIGLTRGAAVSDEFDSADYLNKIEVTDDTLNVRKLLRGRIDLVAAADPVFWQVIQSSVSQEDADRIEFMDPALSRQPLHMAISRNSDGWEQKLADFNAGLRRIREDGTYDAILARHGY